MSLALYPSRVRSSDLLDGIWSLDVENYYSRNCYHYGDAKMLDRALARNSESLINGDKRKCAVDHGGHCEQA